MVTSLHRFLAVTAFGLVLASCDVGGECVRSAIRRVMLVDS